MGFHSDDPVQRQIDAHLTTAQRHYEKGNHEKCDEHLKAATQYCEANNIPHFGRYSLESVIAREARYAERKRVEALKNRGTAKPVEGAAAPIEGRGTQAVFPTNSEGSEAAK